MLSSQWIKLHQPDKAFSKITSTTITIHKALPEALGWESCGFKLLH